MTETEPLELLNARRVERANILRRELERAEREAQRVGRSATCGDKPLEEHYTCAGLRAFSSELGCLCECHDGELLSGFETRYVDVDFGDGDSCRYGPSVLVLAPGYQRPTAAEMNKALHEQLAEDAEADAVTESDWNEEG
jgi:hypothetical protein